MSPRVVSLVPSATETLLAWGVDVVACTRFCEQPDLAHVGGTKDPDIHAIEALAPDLVVVDREENRKEDADALRDAGLDLHVMHVTTLAGLAAELESLAAAVAVDTPTIEIGPSTPEWTSAAVLIWRRPWMSISADTYGSTVLEHLGVCNVFADAPDRYPVIGLAELADRKPELVLLPSEPYPFRARHVAELGARATLIDGQDLFWWGSRTPAALVRLREALRAARPLS
jgi:ABC-type Fe3+-hydroxamate transport system substrate-binding protein